MYKITLDKHRSTWWYSAFNPMGGSFRSNAASRRVAERSALRSVPGGATYRLVVNGSDKGLFRKESNE